MKIHTSYSVKIKKDDGDHIACYRAFEDTVKKYRQAVDFFIDVCLKEADTFSGTASSFDKLRKMEKMTVSTQRTSSSRIRFRSRVLQVSELSPPRRYQRGNRQSKFILQPA